MRKHIHYSNYLFAILTTLVLVISALSAWAFLPSAVRAATPEPDRIATGVAEAKNIAATLAADVQKVEGFATGLAEAKAVAATLAADVQRIDGIATGVAEAKAVAATLSARIQKVDGIATGVADAEAVAATLTADAPKIDRIATGVAEAKAIAATLTAGAPLANQNRVPAISPTATSPVSKGGDYGPTQHCSAKAGFATIELRNIVPNVNSLDLFVDNVQGTTVNYRKYGCIYLKDGVHIFQWKNGSKEKQSNARSFPVNGSDGWYSGSVRSDGVRNPYDAWLDTYHPSPTPSPSPSATPEP
jgi:hypothetical protein